MVLQDKLKAEGGLAETNIILGWHFNFCTLTLTLTKQKHIAWFSKIQTIIGDGRTTKKALESTIGPLGHVGFVIPLGFSIFRAASEPSYHELVTNEQLGPTRITRTI